MRWWDGDWACWPAQPLSACLREDELRSTKRQRRDRRSRRDLLQSAFVNARVFAAPLYVFGRAPRVLDEFRKRYAGVPDSQQTIGFVTKSEQSGRGRHFCKCPQPARLSRSRNSVLRELFNDQAELGRPWDFRRARGGHSDDAASARLSTKNRMRRVSFLGSESIACKTCPDAYPIG